MASRADVGGPRRASPRSSSAGRSSRVVINSLIVIAGLAAVFGIEVRELPTSTGR